MWTADSSVWVDYFNRNWTPSALLLREWLRAGSTIVGDLVMAEILQGLRHPDRVSRVLRVLADVPAVRMGGPDIAVTAAANYRALRARGITIRSTIDCIIATYCIVNDVALLHSDRDFDPFEEHLGLKVVRPAASA
ncbi:MAG: PIN domain nuclease [Dehalococcoidia bacterium]